jgi:hypothetical protein
MDAPRPPNGPENGPTGPEMGPMGSGTGRCRIPSRPDACQASSFSAPTETLAQIRHRICRVERMTDDRHLC